MDNLELAHKMQVRERNGTKKFVNLIKTQRDT